MARGVHQPPFAPGQLVLESCDITGFQTEDGLRSTFSRGVPGVVHACEQVLRVGLEAASPPRTEGWEWSHLPLATFSMPSSRWDVSR